MSSNNDTSMSSSNCDSSNNNNSSNVNYNNSNTKNEVRNDLLSKYLSHQLHNNIIASSSQQQEVSLFATRDSIHSLAKNRLQLLKAMNISIDDDIINSSNDFDTSTNINTNNANNANNDTTKDFIAIKEKFSFPRQVKILLETSAASIQQEQQLQQEQKQEKGKVQKSDSKPKHIQFNLNHFLLDFQHNNDTIITMSNSHSDQKDNIRNIIQTTFSIAAMSVVNGVKLQLKYTKLEEEEEQQQQRQQQNQNDNEEETQPQILQLLNKIDQVKQQCFQSSLNHDSTLKVFQSTPTSAFNSTYTTSHYITNDCNNKNTTRKKRKGSSTPTKVSKDNGDDSLGSEQQLENHKKIKIEDDGIVQSIPKKNNNSVENEPMDNNVKNATVADSRLTTSRAILCTAVSILVKTLTPKYCDYDSSTATPTETTTSTHEKNHDNDDDINILNIPQNTHFHQSNNSSATNSTSVIHDSNDTINMGAVTMSAEIFAKRSIEKALSAVRRSEQRRKWRMDCAKRLLTSRECNGTGLRANNNNNDDDNGVISRWSKWNEDATIDNLNFVSDEASNSSTDSEEDEDMYQSLLNNDKDNDIIPKHQHQLRILQKEKSEQWNVKCLPRIQDIMRIGPGHVILHDLQWKTRFNRVLDILTSLAFNRENSDKPNYGPHLIITTQADYGKYMDALDPLDYFVNNNSDFYLRSLGYNGSKKNRRFTRIKHFTSIALSGQKDAPYNVLVTTYRNFIQDYEHLCQIPFQGVVLDDGMCWLGAANYDTNGQLGKVFDKGVWNQSDHHAGLAGVRNVDWDFSADVSKPKTSDDRDDEDESKKQILLGLTARYKIIVASSLHSKYRDVIYPAPVPGMLSFFFPQFADVVKEEWDRSRIQVCNESIEHIRKLLCRCIVVFKSDNDYLKHIMQDLAIMSMNGKIENHIASGRADQEISENDSTKNKSRYVSTDTLINDGKIVQSRRFAASWLCPGSAIRHELGSTSLHPILNVIKKKIAAGYECEEIVTATSLIPYGSGAVISGPSAFKPAVRCGRSFTSEQGLRQHIAAFHAPPGTWLCRSCGSDCGTSLARTYHERSSCGANNTIANLLTPEMVKDNPTGGIIPTVGQTSKKKKSMKVLGGSQSQEKDENGCICVPGFIGVWVNPEGKHFVKLNDGTIVMSRNDEDESATSAMLFDSVEEAAKKHDDLMKEKTVNKNDIKLNFKDDGTRIVYDKTSTAAAGRNLEMLGGGASSVVPALSVINIKDLPKGVVPLLRDPKQTPRTSGTAKRYVYLYRGVCRQARKGHDRWQSQISFGGNNHYLGTFDSEWDAAAIYAWAHLILYGEDATKKAQKEGEEAVAAYEQEQKDIAEGKIPAPVSSPTVKTPKSKAKALKTQKAPKEAKGTPSVRVKTPKKVNKTTMVSNIKKSLSALEDTKSMYSKMTKGFQGIRLNIKKDDNSLIREVSSRILASRKKEVDRCYCIPVSESTTKFPVGCAVLLGLTPQDFGWEIDEFLTSSLHLVDGNKDVLKRALESEFGKGGMNARFRTIVKGFPCILGKASKYLEEAALTLGLDNKGLGGTIGDIDCNIGGINTCGEAEAVIAYSNTKNSFQLTASASSDSVSVNGKMVNPSEGSVTIGHKTICSIGSRVFVFILIT